MSGSQWHDRLRSRTDLDWDGDNKAAKPLREHGLSVCIEDLSKEDKPLKLFRITTTLRTEYLVTNEAGVCATQEAKHAGSLRWRIEQFHREAKQLTGIANCQARKGRKQRNHLAVAIVVWHQFNELAKQLNLNIYQVKQLLLLSYQKELWRDTAFKFEIMDFA